MTKYVIFLLLISNITFAKPDIQVSGFGTLGLTLNDSEEFGYRADFSKTSAVFKGDFDFAESTKLGIQFDFIFNPEIDVVVQAVYRDQDDLSFDNAVNLFFARYSPSASWSFRVGRTAFDLFLLTEYRDIDYAYQWAHVPAEVYGVLPHRFLDGVDVTYSRPFGEQTFSAKVFHGQTKSTVNAFSNTESVSADFDNVFGIALDLQSLDWDLALNHTIMKIDSPDVAPLVEAITAFDMFVPNFNFIWPNAVSLINEVDLNNKWASYISVSGKYRLDSLTLMSEITTSSSDTLSIKKVTTGYVSTIFHRGQHNYFASIAMSRSDNFDESDIGANQIALAQIPGGMEIYEATRLVLNYYKSNQQTFSLGWRWDFAENISFTLQVDHTQITSAGSTFWQPPTPNSPADLRTGNINTLFASVSFLY
ncbi:hypothetical protein [Glaciecola petra]|uniref:Porin domain-containing protein n=1 Tax=Glaciecola petra TaxID=3075602 RepID=A0ABU2ZRP4_9ALTE|nr:hypothetical protein [Aestuariibacter sp. P117]MDT0595308.1 hypothetical protein [Aestuariibacter sp. P117]